MKTLTKVAFAVIVALTLAACQQPTGGDTTSTDPVTPTYTVSFNTAGGSTIASQTVEEGSVATKPTDPTKTGYAFGGWNFDFGTKITADTVVAVKDWTANTYTITLMLDYTAGDYNLDSDTRCSNKTKLYSDKSNNNNLTGYSYTMKVKYDDVIDLPIPAYTGVSPSNPPFVGWGTAFDYGDDTDAIKTGYRMGLNTTLYVHFQ